METTIDLELKRQLMLNDLAINTQRLSATLPPDGWDLDVPRLVLERRPSGSFDLVSCCTSADAEDIQLMEDTLKPTMHNQDVADAEEKPTEDRPDWAKRMLRCLGLCLGRRQDER